MRAAALLLAAGLCLFAEEDHPPTLPIGSAAPDFSLLGVDGKTHTLHEYDSAKVLVIVFTCVHCPTAQLYEGRIKKLAADYKDKGVTLVAIQPNSPKALRLDEMGYTDLDDSLPDMKIRAEYRHFNFPFLYDGETQSTAHQYGPVATPHVFVFDQKRILKYEGRVDSSQREAYAKVADARNAIDAVLAGKPVAVAKTPTVGCSTKWLYKEASQAKEMHEIESEPVALKVSSLDDLKGLRKNPTGKLLLVNFWATWCGPCTAEMPEIQKMYRMYRHRPFDVVTVATNYPDEQEAVLAFLKKQHASTKNYVFGGTDTYADAAAFDPQWNAADPYTVLIAPDGNVLYKYQGAIVPIEVRRTILKNLPDDDYKGQNAYWNSK
jgi:peroxiredoxin